MNERIKELADQCEGRTICDCGETGFNFEKFSKMVAEKCMNIIAQNRKYASEHKWPASELANVCLYEINETFGVQEDGKETVSG